MNIFVLDSDPKLSAQYHCDKHVVKMILETAQLLCGSHWVSGGEAPYKLSHRNHPCSIWTRECVENYIWLCDLGIELCKEYTYRYGKTHKSQQIIEWSMTNIPNIKEGGNLTPFVLAMPDEYKVSCPVESYRNYYKGAKKDFVSWKDRDIPEWFNINLN
jgi:hypothetical protein